MQAVRAGRSGWTEWLEQRLRVGSTWATHRGGLGQETGVEAGCGLRVRVKVETGVGVSTV